MSHQPTASDALAATNPSGGLVHWRNVLIHAYGVDADIVNLLADEWKMAGCPGGCFGRYAADRKIISETDYSESLSALDYARRKDVVIDETDGGDTLLMMSEIDSSSSDALDLPDTLINIPTIDEIRKATEGLRLTGDETLDAPSVDEAQSKPPTPILPFAVEKSIKERGVLPGQTRLFLRKQNPQPRRSENRPKMERSSGGRPASDRPAFTKPGERTQRITKKTSLLYAVKPNAAVSDEPAASVDSPSASRSRLGRSTVILPPDQRLPSSKHAGLPDVGTKLGEL